MSQQPTVRPAEDKPARRTTLRPGREDPPILGARGFGRLERIGVERDRFNDLYIKLIEARWRQLFGLTICYYLAANTIFAVLYLLGDAPIGGMDEGSFAEHFFFSVQTLSTIGYGAMSPQTPYGHIIVTIESLFGVLSVALITGLVFAKASRPSANLKFSRLAVVTQYDGKPTLMFRVANMRGKELVEATMRLTVLKGEVSPEGHHMRRLHDLKLVRKQTPLFILSWQVMHVIDEDSPLYGVSPEEMAEDGMLLIVTLMGYEGAYAQTVHARHEYYPDQLMWNHRLVDVITRRPDYSVELDLRRFHDVEPERPS
ncbi:MAG: ion channel [Bradymonadia bacterium]